jgi:hypothetical protein
LTPASAQLPAVQHLTLAAAEQAASQHHASPLPTPLVSTPLYADLQQAGWKTLAQSLQSYAALKPLGLRLEGKIKWLEGDHEAASQAFLAAQQAMPPRPLAPTPRRPPPR